jgi:hypothetical protein
VAASLVTAGGGGAASAVGGRRAGMEGRSERGMKTHEEGEAVGWSRDMSTQFTSTHIT